ncbi:hypothetical protein Q3W71_08815 [Micromonospora sp. C28SCA-DRY-2]|uniref:hypothetical protein n=1 Tax=Micromonospora sp. C28SCA-DRY-2 TaxID=3059522 RepID=UPI0026753DBB|nr:hypothetical protein [Micromonospora sp. C28SCA-DRY-2]MDO3701780.1 hypothetical protein [Micromonospora sp. C28SCA-DRY-2]
MSLPPVFPPPEAAAGPPPSGRGTARWWVLGGGLVVVSAVCGVVVFCAGLWTYANHDRPELIDDPPVSEVAESACATMRATVAAKAAPPGAPVDARVRSIREQNAAVTAMVAQVRGLDADLLADDRPTTLWLADWETLVQTRERYAADLAAGGRPHFVAPTADGEPLTDRMNSVGLLCEVPPQLLDLP